MNHVPNAGLAATSTVDLIGFACGRGARDQGCRHGPDAFARALRGRKARSSWNWRRIIGTSPRCADFTALEVVSASCRALAQEVAGSLRQGRRFAVIGGDHSGAIGTWSGASRAMPGALGLIWIDAHMDFHRPETSPSGALHGMPLASLLGFGIPELTGLAGPRPALAPRQVSVIGIRSYEAEEVELAARLGVRVFPMDEIARRGLPAIWAEALAIAREGTAGFGVTIDLDALDPQDAPGVGSPEPGGLRRSPLLDVIGELAADPAFKGIEIAEFNPARDPDGLTSRLVFDLLDAALTAETKDEPIG